MPPRSGSMLFPALLKHWRGRRGLSQLDLALAAKVSARHVSFLETGRSRASREMVLRLAAVLDVPLREQNELLLAAGLPAEFDTPPFPECLPAPLSRALDHMLARQEPYPMVAMDHCCNVLRANEAAERLMTFACAEPSALGLAPNVYHMLFDPRLARPFIEDWPRVARQLLSRLHRESLARPTDAALKDLAGAVLAYPDVPQDWHAPDFEQPSDPVLPFTVHRDGLRLRMLTTITVFNAPQNVTLEDLRIESFFPLDDETDVALHRMAGT